MEKFNFEKKSKQEDSKEQQELDFVLSLTTQDGKRQEYLDKLREEDQLKYFRIVEKLSDLQHEGYMNEKEEPDQSFNENQDFNKNREKIAKKYNILDPTKLEKRDDGKWYINGIEIKKYNELYSGKDSDDIYKKRR